MVVIVTGDGNSCSLPLNQRFEYNYSFELLSQGNTLNAKNEGLMDIFYVHRLCIDLDLLIVCSYY